jgi:hypothetical protein
MVDETQMSGHNGPTTATQSPTEAVAHGVGGLIHDVVELTELQFQLFKMDLRESLLRMAVPAALWAIGGLLLAGCFPIGLICLAEALVHFAGMNPVTAFAIVTIVGALVAVVFAVGGWLLWRRALGTFRRSRDELARNVAWIKRALRRRGRPETSRM